MIKVVLIGNQTVESAMDYHRAKDGNSRKEQDSQEKESDESDNDNDGKDDEKTPPVKQSKRTRKPRMEKKKMAKHYTPKTCPVCLVKVVNLRRHILEVHVKRNERLPLFRLEALVQMGMHSDKTRGRARKENEAGSMKSYKGRRKDICPICERVQQYLSTHLRRAHNLPTGSSQYLAAMDSARRYMGVREEIKYDRKLFKESKRSTVSDDDESDQEPPVKKVKRKPNESDPGPAVKKVKKKPNVSDPRPAEKKVKKKPDESQKVNTEPDESDPEPAAKKRYNVGLEILVKEMLDDNSDTTDEEFIPKYHSQDDENVIPPSPLPSCARSVVRVDGSLELEDSENVEEEGAIENVALEDKEHQEDVEAEYESEEEDEISEEDSDIDEECETWKSYYQKGKGKTTVARLLILFCKHLQSINGGGMKERLAIHHTQNVRKIKECLDAHTGKASNTDINCFLKDGRLDICTVWAQSKLNSKELRPGTVKSYLMSLAKFLEFILDQHDVNGMPTISTETLAKLPKVLNRVRTWGSSINRLYGHERWEQILEDSRNAITMNDIKGMLTFKQSTYAEQCLKSSETERTALGQFIAIRDYLIVRLGVENAQRPGPMESARLRDFQCAEEDGEGSFVMYVARHKTSKAGPAPLVMKRSLYNKVQKYVKFVRPSIANEDEQALFVTQDGKAFDHGTIGKRVIAWWNKATGKNITSTDLRKLAGSTLHDADPVEKRIVHSHMCHLATTAEKYYMTRDKTKIAGKSHSTIVKNLEIEQHEEENQDPDKAVESTNVGNFEKSLDEQVPEEETNSKDADSANNIAFDTTQLQDIDLLFSEYITTNAKIAVNDVRKTMEESCSLLELTKDECGEESIQPIALFAKERSIEHHC